MRLIVVATDEEYKLACERFTGEPVLKLGVGGINTLKKLDGFNRGLKILNFGYAGSNNIPVGTEVKVGSCCLYHPNVDFEEEVFILNGDVPCYTSNDFVLETKIKEPCVFDMELAYILALGFKDVEAIKIVSDNLSLKQYEQNIN